MKGNLKLLVMSFVIIFVFSMLSYAQDSKSHGKSFYTWEEVKRMCGVPVDTVEMRRVIAKQDSMYREYISKTKKSVQKLNKIETIPNWQGIMSSVEYQGNCGDCWVHAATGIVEGQLHILNGSKIGGGIDLDELEITNACNGGFPAQAENFIQTSKMRSEVSSYPNLSGVRWGIIGYNTISGISAIKNALVNGPVAASFYVYDDFSPFFRDYPTGVYTHSGGGNYGGHAVVIVSYDDNGQYWLCKNSWGDWWGDNGYFRIGYGQCAIESWENSVVTVNQSCYAKIVPNIFSTMTIAFNYNFVNNEYACFVSPYTLPDNVTVPVNKRLLLYNGETLDINSCTIVSTGGTITVENGADIHGVMLKTGSTINAIYPSVQAAVNNWSTPKTIQVMEGTFDEWVSISNKTSIIIDGTGSTVVTGISIANSNGAELTTLATNYLGISNCTLPHIQQVVITPYSEESEGSFLMYNSSYVSLQDIMLFNAPYYGAAFSNSTGLFFPTNGMLFENNELALGFYSSSSFTMNQPYFCSNEMDIATDPSSYVLCNYGPTFSGDPNQTTYGNVTWYSYSTCGQYKTSSSAQTTTNFDKDISFDKFQTLNTLYNETSKKINETTDKKSYSQDFSKLINECKLFLSENVKSAFAPTVLNLAVHSYKQFDDYEGMKTFLMGVMEDKNLVSLSGHAKRSMIDYYSYLRDYTTAISTADEIISDKAANQDLLCDALYAKGLIYEYSLGNKEEAVNTYSVLVKNYPDNSLAKFAKQQLKKFGVNFGKETPKIAGKQEEETAFSSSNYPNPFNPTTTISYTLPEDGKVLIKVFDVLGREVITLIDGVSGAGKHNVVWDGSNFSSGIYFYSITFNSQTLYKKMLLMK